MSAIVSLGPRTVTGLLTTLGRQFQDWSADYRLFSCPRFDSDAVFGAIRRSVTERLRPDAPLVVAMDDSLLPKTGTKTSGVAWRRDPMGPPFQTNLIRAQRVLQISAVLPDGELPASARVIPIDYRHAPTPVKPGKRAPAEAHLQYQRMKKEKTINRQGAERLLALRRHLDEDPDGERRPLWVAVDGRFTNGTVLSALPERTTLIGRIRKDTTLYYLPEASGEVKPGRKPDYGLRAPTPEELRQNDAVPWEKVEVWAAGKCHEFKVKSIGPVRWRVAGGGRDLRLVVIAPLAYRPRKGSRLLYRQPAYLICTDPGLPLQDVLQAYVWRWGVELNFRDEKQLLGVGEAEVRNAESVEAVPQLLVASYAMLLLAGERVWGREGSAKLLPRPKWRRNLPCHKLSTMDLINHLRAELWGKALGVDHFSGFSTRREGYQKPEKLSPDLASAVLYIAA